MKAQIDRGDPVAAAVDRLAAVLEKLVAEAEKQNHHLEALREFLAESRPVPS